MCVDTCVSASLYLVERDDRLDDYKFNNVGIRVAPVCAGIYIRGYLGPL